MSEHLPAPSPESGLKQKIVEAGQYAFEASQLAYFALGATVAERKLQRAGSVMEKIDHKDALYADLGQIALTGQVGAPTPTAHRGRPLGVFWDPISRTYEPKYDSEPAAPRTFIEKRVDARWNKKSSKLMLAQTEKARAGKIYGTEEVAPSSSPYKTLEEAFNAGYEFDLAPKAKSSGPKKPNTIITSDLGTLPRTKTELTDQANDLFLASHIPGYNKRQKALMKMGVRASRFTKLAIPASERRLNRLGLKVDEISDVNEDNAKRTHKRTLTAREKQDALLAIDARPIKQGAKMHRHVNKNFIVADKSVKISTAQPISSRIRAIRQKRAIGKIQKQWVKKHKMVEEADKVRDKRIARS